MNKTTIEIGETEEGLNILDLPRFRPILAEFGCRSYGLFFMQYVSHFSASHVGSSSPCIMKILIVVKHCHILYTTDILLQCVRF